MSLSFLRSLLITDPMIILATVVMGSLSVATSFFDPEGRRQHTISRKWARMLLVISGVKVNCRGLDRLKPDGYYVFVGNHLSLMDTPVVLGHIPRQFLFLVNIKYVKLPFLGTHLRRSGHFAVDPNDTKAGLKILSDAARRIRERKLSVLLFPEGSRSRGGLQEFKEGAAYIAIKSGAQVVPFALKGTREVLPVGSVHIQARTVEFLLGEPISTEGLTLKERGELTRCMRDRVAGLMARLDGVSDAAKTP
ncbi:MAG: 1-acyl-sn-glycerol-3-phosphate acyltransferase [Acidimicrobiia bacterium]|nr:1-acyl-sn-glycerol-3-phosphate acyltransferase [Acidimicrobiia bacterium]